MKDYARLYKEAEEVATLAHQYQNYDIFPYTKHLRDVVRVLETNGFVNDYIIAGWLHDVLEDAGLTYNKIKRAFGKNAAELVFAVTDPKARNRKEKKVLVYRDIKEYPKSIIIKLADRIANVEHSITMGNMDKTSMYLKEHEEFKKELYDVTPEDGKVLWDILERIMYNEVVANDITIN